MSNDLYEARKENYESKKERRISKYKSRTKRATSNADMHRQIADNAVEGIPMGQPILIGHHSEKKHRAALKKCHTHMDKTIQEQDKAAYYFEKALAAESNSSISSDDPDAVKLLKEKIDVLKKKQESMKCINKEFKKWNADKNYKMQLTDEEKAELLKEIKRMPTYEHQPYPRYSLTSINNKIKAAENRIKQLEKLTNIESKTYTIEGISGIEFENNIVENRFKVYTKMGKEKSFQLGLPGIFKKLGFVWCRTDSCYQRKLSSLSGYVKAALIETLKGVLK